MFVLNKFSEFSKSKKIFYCFSLILILLTRLSFLFKGSRSFIDESRYSFSLRALDSLQKKDITGFFYCLSSTSGRPGAALINLIPATMQGVLYALFRINPDTPDSYLLPFLFNYLVLIATMYLLYRVGLLVLHNREVALSVVLIYSCLVNTNIYINHLLPYDVGVLISTFIVFRVLSIAAKNKNFTKLQAFEIGGLAMLLFAEYPGYYLLVPTAGLMLIRWNQLFTRFGEHIVLFVSYVSGILAVFGFFEGMARLGGVSYIESNASLSGTISQGSFEECFSFIFKYLVQVEGILGIILILSIIGYALLIIRYSIGKSVSALWRKVIDSPVHILFLCAIGSFLAYASVGYFLHKVVFYGRLIHPYILYITLFCTGGLLIRGLYYYKGIAVIVNSIAIVSFIFFSVNFLKLEYPRDLLYKYKIDTASKNVRYRDEVPVETELFHYKSPMMYKVGQGYSTYLKGVVLVNFASIFPQNNISFTAFKPSANNELLHEGQHFSGFPAYTFEGLDAGQRSFMREHYFMVKLYKNE